MSVPVMRRPEQKFDNPPTWVRDAWNASGTAEVLDGGTIPAGVSEAEWDMLYKHVRLDQPYAQIGKGYSEPGSRIRQFCEAATRQIIPSQAMQTEAAGMNGDLRTVSALVGAQNLYVAIGSPFGNDPGMVGPVLQALANHGGALEAIREALAADPIELPSGDVTQIAPASSAELLKGEDDR